MNCEATRLNSHWIGDTDGIAETERLWLKRQRTNDANYVYFNPRLGCYEQFSQWFLAAPTQRRVEIDNCPNFNRMIQRRLSSDGLNWSTPELVIQADDQDPWDQQFYHLAVQYHEDWLVGSLGHYRVEEGQQTMDLELVFSRDGRRWERPLRGGFIPRDPDGRDSEGVYPGNAWVDRGDRWLTLYTGTKRKHCQHAADGILPSVIMGATWPKHRFVGQQTNRVGGGFMTDVFYLSQPQLLLDATINGWLRAELCDAWGNKLDGFNLRDAVPISGDNTGHQLAWRDKSIYRYLHDPLRLRFEYTDGIIYALQF